MLRESFQVFVESTAVLRVLTGISSLSTLAKESFKGMVTIPQRSQRSFLIVGLLDLQTT